MLNLKKPVPYKLLANLVIFYLLLVSELAHSQSKSISEQIEQYKSSIVLLHLEGSHWTTGAIGEIEATGFVLCSPKYVLTAKHPFNKLKEEGYIEGIVIAGSIRANEGLFKRRLEIVQENESDDLLLLEFKGETPQNISPVVLSDGIKPSLGEKIYSLGFPSLMSTDLIYKDGSMSGDSLVAGLWLVNMPLNNVDSGSPIFNGFGQVVAVVKDGFDKFEGVNEVIPTSQVDSLLTGIACEVKSKAPISPIDNQSLTQLDELEAIVRKQANQDPIFSEQIPQVREEYFVALRETFLRLLQSNSANVEEALELFKQGDTKTSLEKLDVYVRGLEEEQKRASQEASQGYLDLALLDSFTSPEKSLEHLQKAVSLYDENLRALSQLGALQIRLDQPYKAIESFETLSRLAGEQGDKGWQANALGNLGIAYSGLGHRQQAISYYKQALAINQEIGDRLGESNNLGNLGLAYLSLTQYQQAINYHEQALAIAQETGDRLGESNNLGNLGVAYSNLGQYQQAINHHEQALKIAREIEDRLEESNNLGNLGLAYLNLGQYQQAINHYEQVLMIAQATKDKLGESSDFSNLGVAYLNLGQYQQAINHYEKALAINQEIGDKQGEGSNLSNLGIAYLNLGQYLQAINYYEQALAIAQGTGDRLREGSNLGNLGLAYLNLGQYQQSINYLEQAIAIAQETGDKQSKGSNLGNLGVSYLNLGQYSAAEKYLKQSLAILEEINSPHVDFFRDKLEQLEDFR